MEYIDKEDLSREPDEPIEEYQEPVLLGAQDLTDVAGGCAFGCANGSCSKTG